MKKNDNRKSIFSYMNKWILVISIVLVFAGAFLILDASSISSIIRYHNSSAYYFFERQLLMIAGGLFLAIIVLLVPTKHYKLLSFFGSIGCIVVMLITLGASKVTGNISTVTIRVAGITLQPAEVLKVTLVMYMGCYYGSWVNKEKKKRWTFFIPLIPCGLGAFIVLLGGDFGTCAIMCSLYALVLLCVPSKDIFIKKIKLIVSICFLSAVLFLKFGYLIIPDAKLEEGGRLSRFNYVNACDNYETIGYQVCNGYIAMDNGGLFGTGLGNSVQKYLYLDESHTDFIFPIIIEEFGALTGVFIILLYMALLYLVFRIASNTNTLQNSIICYGIGIYFMLHVFVNLSGVLGVFPVTGVPLPFLSYGGSFCITMLVSFAIVQRICIENGIYKK